MSDMHIFTLEKNISQSYIIVVLGSHSPVHRNPLSSASEDAWRGQRTCTTTVEAVSYPCRWLTAVPVTKA